jgi:hypothetical protein
MWRTCEARGSYTGELSTGTHEHKPGGRVSKGRGDSSKWARGIPYEKKGPSDQDACVGHKIENGARGKGSLRPAGRQRGQNL